MAKQTRHPTGHSSTSCTSLCCCGAVACVVADDDTAAAAGYCDIVDVAAKDVVVVADRRRCVDADGSCWYPGAAAAACGFVHDSRP